MKHGLLWIAVALWATTAAPDTWPTTPNVYLRNGTLAPHDPLKIENKYWCCSWDYPVECEFEITWWAEPGSGGHLHNNNRPPGQIRTSNENTYGSIGPGPSGYLREWTSALNDYRLGIEYQAPEPSGIINICAQAWYMGLNWGYHCDTIDVRIPNLDRPTLPPPFVVATYAGITLDHDHHNGYAAPVARDRLAAAAAKFSELLAAAGVTPPSAVTLDAIGLPKGGLKDLYAATEWHPEHWEHRYGTDVDILLTGLGPTQKKLLATALTYAGFRYKVPWESWIDPASTHWRVRVR